MKNLSLITILAIFAYSCGEAGVGFNVGKEFPIPIPVKADDIQTLPVDISGFNPDPYEQSISYSISSVDAFEGVDIGEVVVKGFAYEIKGVNDETDSPKNENYNVENLSLKLSAEGNVFADIPVSDSFTNNELTNVVKTQVTTFDPNALSQLLLNGGEIKGDVVFDFGEVPEDGFDFEFIFYFDILVKARNL